MTEPRNTPARTSIEIVRIRQNRNRRAFIFLAGLGIAMLVFEYVLSALMGNPVAWGRIALAAIVAFIGFGGLDFTKAKDGFAVIVDGSVRILSALPIVGRFTRRASDIPGSTTITVAPVSSPEIAAVVEAPADLPDTPNHGDTGSRKAAPRDTMGEEGV